MRRARLKVTATVPIRRKYARENATVEQSKNPPKCETPGNENVLTEISDKREIADPICEVTTDTPTQPIVGEDNKLNDTPIIMVASSISTNDTTTLSPSKSLSGRSCFPRPIPRLDGHGRIRRNSVQGSGASASESEDDSRRNITVLAVNSVRSEAAVQNEKQYYTPNNSLNLSKVAVKTKRKMMVSESARKLAEARREFQLKHENKPPDRSQLKMYDFIYYNPATNPMKKKSSNTNKISSIVQTPMQICVNVASEEDADDPTPTAMPVPQVKVGPDGQLIIDEQSLVIENTGVKESREALANQAVVIDDNDFGNGFYKRRKKTKEWPEWETIKFYKALNTVGTDFLLMQSLFPKRGRQELKIKFKKEERINRVLVEKALKYSQEFDIDLLKKELESFESPEQTAPKPPFMDCSSKNAPKQSRKRKQASRRIAAMSICEEDADDDITYDNVDKPTNKAESVDVQIPSRSSHVGALLQYKDCNEADNESDSEIYKVRLTRSGRKPKLKKIRTYTKHTLDTLYENDIRLHDISKPTQFNISDEKKNKSVEQHVPAEQGVFTLENDSNPLADISGVEPGSLVIVSKESVNEPGETVVQVYMVSTEENGEQMNLTKTMTPVDINPESLSILRNETPSDAALSLFRDLTDAS